MGKTASQSSNKLCYQFQSIHRISRSNANYSNARKRKSLFLIESARSSCAPPFRYSLFTTVDFSYFSWRGCVSIIFHANRGWCYFHPSNCVTQPDGCSCATKTVNYSNLYKFSTDLMRFLFCEVALWAGLDSGANNSLQESLIFVVRLIWNALVCPDSISFT